MSHLLIIDLPGGNDTDILAAALAGGHRFSFLTADPAHYRTQHEVAALLAQAEAVIDAESFAMPALIPRLMALHRANRFDAVLCLQDLRIVEAADIARALGLRHLNPGTARMARNKAEVRRRLNAAGLPQPVFTEVRGPAELIAAAETMGLPLLVKPIDGFGSQNIFALRSPEDLAALRLAPEIIADGPGHYGLGVAAGGAMLVERLLEGRLLGCDTLTVDGRHRLLGVNEKLLFPAPSFAIRGGCFTTACGQFGEIEAYAFRLLDAIGFDQGAAHIEIMLTAEGPALIEINPRLVGAKIARLLSAALGRSVHADLIALHAEGRLPPPSTAPTHAVTRWLAAPCAGVLREIGLPEITAPGFVGATLMARPGDAVTPPYDNADRLGCVITCDTNRPAAEALAEEIVGGAHVRMDSH
jgi:biotin carboxylase